MLRQADIADTSLSAIDEHVGAKISAMPEVQSTSGMIFTAVMLPEAGGSPSSRAIPPTSAIHRFRIIEGESLRATTRLSWVV